MQNSQLYHEIYSNRSGRKPGMESWRPRALADYRGDALCIPSRNRRTLADLARSARAPGAAIDRNPGMTPIPLFLSRTPSRRSGYGTTFRLASEPALR